MKSVKFSKQPAALRAPAALAAAPGAGGCWAPSLALIGRSLYLQGFNNDFLGDKGAPASSA
jgi:hypothetical protein